MKRRYRVTVEADFEIEGYSPEQIKEKLMKVIKQQGFSNINFEVQISRIQKIPAQRNKTEEVKNEKVDIFSKYLGRKVS